MSSPYPQPPRGDDVEQLAGLSFGDPFRQLESPDDPAVALWQVAQNELADAYVAALPDVDELRSLVECYSVERFASLPRFAGDRWFRTEWKQGAAQRHAVVSIDPCGAGEVVFDPAEHANGEGQEPYLSWLSPSLDGRLLALGLCFDGSEANVIRIVDVASGQLLDDRPPHLLMDNWMGGAQWLPGSTEFFYVAIEGDKEDFQLRVFRHSIGHSAPISPEPVPLLEGPGEDYVAVVISQDGRWAIASQNLMRPKPVAVLDLSDRRAGWRPFLTEIKATIAGHVVDDEYIALTDTFVSRGSVVAIPLVNPEGSDPSAWRVIVPESDAVIRSVTPIGNVLYISEFVDTYSRIRIVDKTGVEIGEVELPGRGALSEMPFPLMTVIPTHHPREYVFAFSSLTHSWGTYRHRPGNKRIEVLKEPEVYIEAVVEDCWATSTDGASVPYHIVRRQDVCPSEQQPALVYAYGGFNVPLVPQFPRGMAAFVDAGGLFIHAHLRGGGEFGLEWWEAGRMKNKQNCYSDLFAIAEDLVRRGRTSAERLAVTGGSNGGLLTGVAITQRPELWRAAVPRVPLLDVLGACREPYGRAAVAEEFGDPDDPADVERMAAFSPYQLIEDGVPYPAVFLDAGATDPRCPAWHARKFAARLQEATSSDLPVFLRVWEHVGHGWATGKHFEAEQWTAWLAFVLDQLGLPCIRKTEPDDMRETTLA
jgi:prolyl oligopeptidase